MFRQYRKPSLSEAAAVQRGEEKSEGKNPSWLSNTLTQRSSGVRARRIYLSVCDVATSTLLCRPDHSSPN